MSKAKPKEICSRCSNERVCLEGMCHRCRHYVKKGAQINRTSRGSDEFKEKMRKFGENQRGDKNPTWKGGRIKDKSGYVWVIANPNDPIAMQMRNAGTKNYVQEHRLVVAYSLNRPLSPLESVHHINGVRDDNRLENLQLRQGVHGNGVAMSCLDCGSHNLGFIPLADPSEE